MNRDDILHRSDQMGNDGSGRGGGKGRWGGEDGEGGGEKRGVRTVGEGFK